MKQLLRGLIYFVCLTVLSGSAWAQYMTSGPSGGAVYSFYRENSRIYSGGSGGVYASNDEGKSWQELSNAPAALGCDQIYSVASSAGDIYAGSSQSGIFNSSDGGLTWHGSVSGLRINIGTPYADVEIAGPNVFAIRPDSGFLFISNDHGNNWVRFNLAISNAFAQYLSIHNGDLYVSTFQGLFRSTNNGINFTNIDTVFDDFGELVWSGDTAYVGTSTGIKRSLDGGMNFTTVALAGRQIRNLSVVGSNMYAVVRNPAPIQDSVLYSTNGGANFSAAPFNSSTFRFTNIHDILATKGGAVVGSNYGLYGSFNSGSSWGLADSGYHATTVKGLAISGSYLIAGTTPMGIFRVEPDSGALYWQHSGDVAHNVNGNIQAISSKGAIVHAGGPAGYFRSTNNGATWTAGAIGVSNGNITSIYASQSSQDVWMIRNGNLYSSLDDGNSFGHVVNSNVPAGVARYVTRADTALFVASFATLYKGGSAMTFSPVTGISGIVTAVVRQDTTFYAATEGNGLYSSINGSTWTPVVIALPGILPSKINTLIASDTGLIAGTDDGVYSNASGTWARLTLPDYAVYALAERNDKLFIGTCGGVYSIPYKIEVPPISIKGVSTYANGLQIWPNPTQGGFSLRVNSLRNADAELQVTDVRGMVVYRERTTLTTGTNTLRIETKQLSLASGVYTVQVAGEGLRATSRVVIY